MAQALLFILIGAGLLIGVLWAFRPGSGWYWRGTTQVEMTDRVRAEDAVKHVHLSNLRGLQPTLESLAGALQVTGNEAAAVAQSLTQFGLAELRDGQLHLQPRGVEAALHIIRVHRLWEQHLAEGTSVSEGEWHAQADRIEHQLSPLEADKLAAQMGNPLRDPHGDPIPSQAGSLRPQDGLPLSSGAVNQSYRIVHIEDEPVAIFSQIVASGLQPEMELRVLENSARRVRVWADGCEHVLAPLLAANVAVRPVEVQAQEVAQRPLSDLEPGQASRVVSISHSCRGLERRRLLDLGLLPGTMVYAELRSPSGDPTAYRIRDTLIALRRTQAQWVRVE